MGVAGHVRDCGEGGEGQDEDVKVEDLQELCKIHQPCEETN